MHCLRSIRPSAIVTRRPSFHTQLVHTVHSTVRAADSASTRPSVRRGLRIRRNVCSTERDLEGKNKINRTKIFPQKETYQDWNSAEN